MNVADKAGWLACVRRHLAPRRPLRVPRSRSPARAASAERYPVPWAATAADSHLVTPDAVAAWRWRPAGSPCGTGWRRHRTDGALAGRGASRRRRRSPPPAIRPRALSVRLLLGPDAATHVAQPARATWPTAACRCSWACSNAPAEAPAPLRAAGGYVILPPLSRHRAAGSVRSAPATMSQGEEPWSTSCPNCRTRATAWSRTSRPRRWTSTTASITRPTSRT